MSTIFTIGFSPQLVKHASYNKKKIPNFSFGIPMMKVFNFRTRNLKSLDF
jgi:hypothetical protein